MIIASAAHAQETAERSFDIPAQPLADALVIFGVQSDLQVTTNGAALRGIRTNGVKGTLVPVQALSQLLTGTGFTFRINGNVVTLERAPQASGDGAIQLGPVRIEGQNNASEIARFGDAPKEPGGFKAEYQTTATKTPLPLKETPQAISVVTRDSIEARQAGDIVTALELSAGVSGRAYSVGPFGGAAFRGQTFTLRGQSAAGTRDIRTDGFALGNNITSDLAPYERIEVVKGPSGYYGQGSLGGFINLVRKKPQAEFGASGSIQVGSYDTYRAEVDITGALNGDETLRGRLVGAYSDFGSYVDFVGTQRQVLAPSIEAIIGERTRVLVHGLYQSEKFVRNLGIPLRDDDGSKYYRIPPRLSRSTYYGHPGDKKSEADLFDISARIDHELSDSWLLTLAVQAAEDSRDVIDTNYGYGLYGDGDTYVYAGRWQRENDRWAGEIRLDGKLNAFGQEHNVIFGLEKNRRHNDYRAVDGDFYIGSINVYTGSFESLTNPIIDNFDDGRARRRTSANEAFYAQGIFSLSDRTKLLAGVRYDRADQTYYESTSGATLDQKLDTKWTTRIGLIQELTSSLNVYVAFAQSFNPVTADTRTGEILDSETGKGYEIGLKGDWFDNRLSATLALYRQDLDNRPIRDPANGPGENFSVSGGLHRTDGLELEIAGSPIPGLTIATALALSDNEFLDPLDTRNFGFPVYGSINRQFSIYVNYEFQQGLLEGLGVGGTLVSVGDTFVDLPFFGTDQGKHIEGYERFDLNFSYNRIPGLDMSLQVRNVTNTVYIERPFGIGYQNYFGSPRAVLFTIKKSFGAFAE